MLNHKNKLKRLPTCEETWTLYIVVHSDFFVEVSYLYLTMYMRCSLYHVCQLFGLTRSHYVALNTEVDANMTHGPYIKNKVKVQSRGHSTARTYGDVFKYIIYIIVYV